MGLGEGLEKFGKMVQIGVGGIVVVWLRRNGILKLLLEFLVDLVFRFFDELSFGGFVGSLHWRSTESASEEEGKNSLGRNKVSADCPESEGNWNINIKYFPSPSFLFTTNICSDLSDLEKKANFLSIINLWFFFNQ